MTKMYYTWTLKVTWIWQHQDYHDHYDQILKSRDVLEHGLLVLACQEHDLQFIWINNIKWKLYEYKSTYRLICMIVEAY